MKVSTLAAILAVVACGGSAADGPIGPSASCTITLSGAISATLKCAAADAAYSSANNQGGVSLTAVPSGTVQSFTMALGTTGQPQATT